MNYYSTFIGLTILHFIFGEISKDNIPPFFHLCLNRISFYGYHMLNYYFMLVYSKAELQ